MKNKHAKRITAINLFMKNIDLKFAVGLSISPTLWNSDLGRPYTNYDVATKIKTLTELNASESLIEHWKKIQSDIKAQLIDLENIETRLSKIDHIVKAATSFAESTEENIDLKSYIEKQLYSRYRNKEIKKSKISFFKFYDEVVERMITGKKRTKHGKYAKKTCDTYKTHKVKIETFSKNYSLSENGKKPYLNLGFEDFDEDFYEDFIFWLEEQGYKPNYQGNIIKSLKAILTEAVNKGHNVNLEFRNFIKPSEETFAIALTLDEVEKIRELDLTALPRSYSITRDMFLIGIGGIMAASEYFRIDLSMITETEKGKTITINRNKSGVKCVIPIKEEMDKILKKYNYQMPSLAKQTSNKLLKKIGKLANINTMVLGIPKYNYIKNHTARRTGATINYYKGIDITQIMSVGGWKTEKEFRKYLKITKEEYANKLLSNNEYMNNQYH